MLASVLGVAFDDNLALEFSDCLQLLVFIQNKLAETDVSSYANEVELSEFIDELLVEVVRGFKSLAKAPTPIKVDDYSTFGNICNQPELNDMQERHSAIVLRFFDGARQRCDKMLKDQNRSASDRAFLMTCKARIDVCFILMMRGISITDVDEDEIVACVTQLFLSNQMDPAVLMRRIIELTEADVVDGAALAEVFNPVFTKLRRWITLISIHDRFSSFITQLPVLIHQLLTLQHNGKRPLTEVLVAREDFIPEILSESRGREITVRSYLGPIFGMSTISDEDLESTDLSRYEDDHEIFREPKQRVNLYKKYEPMATSLRSYMHSIVHVLLANVSTRQRTLTYLARVLEYNRKRTQIQANRVMLAGDCTMLNVMSVMFQLSEKIAIDRVEDWYVSHPKALVNLRDEARISFSPDVVESVEMEAAVDYELKFPTECFYLTIFAMSIGLYATVEHTSRIRIHLVEVRRAYREFVEMVERKGTEYASTDAVRERLVSIQKMEKRMTIDCMCHQCLLHNEALILQAVKFINQQLQLVLRSISADLVSNTIPEVPPKVFGTLPEFFIESTFDFMVYALREAPEIFLVNSVDIAKQLLVLSCCLHFFKNPYLASKVVNVVFLVTPMVNPAAEALFRRIVNNSFAGQHLFASLSKFYADVESTGAHTEFYDKFNIRRSIQVIFKCMWTYLIHRRSMIEVAEHQSPEFIRFINMVINDTTFLLDESLTGLKKIRDIELLMENEAEFSALLEEDRNQKISALNEVKRSVRTWMILCNDTLDFFILLTTDNARIFYNTLGERVAAMLNYNIVQLCGPKCIELKVKDAKQRFEWDPRKLLQQIVSIYLNLASETFAENIAQDERSYTPDTFAVIVEKMKSRHILEMSQTERFQNLIEMANSYYIQKAQEEMDFGDDIPNEFIDELVYTLMVEPVRLPSGQVVDKKHIMRHLLSDKTNPFTRQPLTPEELIPDVELKERIDSWVAEKRAAARR